MLDVQRARRLCRRRVVGRSSLAWPPRQCSTSASRTGEVPTSATYRSPSEVWASSSSVTLSVSGAAPASALNCWRRSCLCRPDRCRPDRTRPSGPGDRRRPWCPSRQLSRTRTVCQRPSACTAFWREHLRAATIISQWPRRRGRSSRATELPTPAVGSSRPPPRIEGRDTS